ncbi:MAG TPA: branched-chain amino acid ABC transporter substrate-binding protein [Chloroflexota bacterium]
MLIGLVIVTVAGASPGRLPTGAAIAPSAQPAAQKPPDSVRIVSSLPLLGSTASISQSIVNAIGMAVEEHDRQPGKLRVVYEPWNDASAARGSWDPNLELVNARRAASEPDVMAYLGPFNSGAAQVAIPVLNYANLVIVSPANTYPGLTRSGGDPREPAIFYPTGVRNYARVVPPDDVQGMAAARWARQLGAQRVYVLDDGERYGHWLAGAFHQEATRLGLTVLPADDPERLDVRGDDYRAVAARIGDTQPDLVYFGGITQDRAGELWQALRSSLGANVALMGPDGIFERAFLDAAGQAALATYLTSPGVPVNSYPAVAAAWADRYRAMFAGEPDFWAIYGYEAANVVLDAIARVDRPDRDAIRAAVMATRDYNGVLGRWSFDENGDTTLRTISGSQVRGPTYEDVQLVTLLDGS